MTTLSLSLIMHYLVHIQLYFRLALIFIFIFSREGFLSSVAKQLKQMAPGSLAGSSSSLAQEHESLEDDMRKVRVNTMLDWFNNVFKMNIHISFLIWICDMRKVKTANQCQLSLTIAYL